VHATDDAAGRSPAAATAPRTEAKDGVAATRPSRGFLAGPAAYRGRQLEFVMLVVVLSCLAPYLVRGVYGQGQLISIADYAILTLGFYWSFVLAGEFTFAVFGFFAIGSYASVWVADRTDFWVGLLAATIGCTVIGALLKLALRRTGVIYFAMGTIAFGSLVIILFQNWTGFTGGFAGKGNIPLPGLFGYQLKTLASHYYLLIAVMAIVLIATVLVERSPARRDLIFARDLGPVASTAGLRPDRLKIIAFAVGCGIQGAAGSLFAHTTTYLSLDSFTTQVSLNVLLMILLGGIGSIYGPLLGALVIVEIPEVLRFVQSYADLVYAALVLVVIVAFPFGITGLRGQPPGRFVTHQLRRLGNHRPGGGLDDA
jgi:branched-chain amino acid transport system permease protein